MKFAATISWHFGHISVISYNVDYIASARSSSSMDDWSEFGKIQFLLKYCIVLHQRTGAYDIIPCILLYFTGLGSHLGQPFPRMT